MNPNSSHQLWSLWTTTVTLPFHQWHTTDVFRREMQVVTARAYRRLFGSAAELRMQWIVQSGVSAFRIECRAEGVTAPDPVFRKLQMQRIADWFARHLRHYGPVDVHVDVRIEAGDVGDGRPAAQLVLGPPVALLPHISMLSSAERETRHGQCAL